MRIYHSARLRKGRHSEPGRPYLVTTTTRNRTPVFHDFHAGRLLVSTLRDADSCQYTDTLAWVIMPDHLHWLLVPGSESIHAIMRRIKSCSARCINRHIGHTGPLWQNGFHDHAVRKEEDLAAIARYIIANPVRAGLVRSVREYPLWYCIYI